MLNITYAARDQQLAQQLQTDLQQARLTLDHSYLLVLLSPAALQDDTIQQNITAALRDNVRVIPILLENVAIPSALREVPPVNFSGGYRAKTLIAYLKRAEVGAARLASNQRILGFIAIMVAIMFGVSIWGITSGQVAFPDEEYATENARNNATMNAQIDGLVQATLEEFMPRTTADALNFDSTVQAAPTRIQEFLGGTATALPQNRQATLAVQATIAVGTIAAQTLTPATTPAP
jgi:hypothetical protein